MKAVYNYSIHIYIHINLCSSLLYNTNIQDIYHHPPIGPALWTPETCGFRKWIAWLRRWKRLRASTRGFEAPVALVAETMKTRNPKRLGRIQRSVERKMGCFFLVKHPENRKVELWLVYEEIEEQVEYGMVKDILVSRAFDLQIPLVQDD